MSKLCRYQPIQHSAHARKRQLMLCSILCNCTRTRLQLCLHCLQVSNVLLAVTERGASRCCLGVVSLQLRIAAIQQCQVVLKVMLQSSQLRQGHR